MASSEGKESFGAAVRIDEALDAAYGLLHRHLHQLGEDLADAKVRTEAVRALDIHPLPSAIFDRAGATHPNARWKTLFDGVPVLPESLRLAIESASSAARTIRVADLSVRLPTHVAIFAAQLHSFPFGILAVLSDVTDDALARQLEADASALMLSASVADGATYYSESWRRAVGTGWRQAISGRDDLGKWNEAFEKTATTGTADVEVRIKYRDRQPRRHLVRFRAHEGRVLAYATDIEEEMAAHARRTALMEAERAAREDAVRANRLKDEFLATVSHELRAPLTTLLLWAKVLRGATDERSRLQALDAIQHSVTTQARLVADLLDVSRGISGKLYLDVRLVDIEHLVREACDAARPLATAKVIELLTKVGPNVGSLNGDATRLRQIIDNLLSNAIKFTNSGGRVVVSIGRRGRTVSIDVEDNGRGIAPELMARIFDPFTQVDETLTRAEGGLGLGLTIARHLTELHHGTLTVSSPGLGKGACFSLHLRSTATGRAPTPVPRNDRRLDGASILVIDDDARVREALEVLLQRSGVRVHLADSASAARTFLESNRADAIICDIAMPGEDGYSFARTLRSSAQTLPLIALTAYAMDFDAGRALEAGFDMHLAKPISFERLVAALSDLLEGRRA